MYRLDVFDLVGILLVSIACDRAVPSIPPRLYCEQIGSCKVYKAPSIELNAANIMGYDMGLYKLQHMTETCTRYGGPSCPRPIRTWPKNRISK